MRDAIRLREPDDYFLLAEGVEAWAFRYMMERAELISRREAAGLWWSEEYEPAVRLLRDEDLIADLAEDDPGLTDTEAYLRFSAQRYRLLRTHAGTSAPSRSCAGPRRCRSRAALASRRS